MVEGMTTTRFRPSNTTDSFHANLRFDSIELDESEEQMKSTLIREFKQWKELQLIEIVNVKMHLKQFASIVHLIQMRLMKVTYKMKSLTNQRVEQLEAITIDRSDEFENASDSIRVNRAVDSNVMNRSFR
jgi:hypothetical protein